ncbi:MAG: hypothetical protein KAI81_09205, partial [Candidatus Marinimicrobia bacterium]|nr:hypothetical protein [Candidatus Neomarinimicrobiota bacterium]
MYFISTQGSMVHKQGENFQKEDVPNYKYYRIDGIEEPGDYGQRVWVSSMGEIEGDDTEGAAIYYNGLQWQTLWNSEQLMYDPVYDAPGAIYTDSVDKFVLFSVGGSVDNILALHNQKYPQQFTLLSQSGALGFIKGISGNDLNDFFIVGNHNTIIHYNGESFYSYEGVAANSLTAVSMVGDKVYISQNNGAVMYIGTRK